MRGFLLSGNYRFRRRSSVHPNVRSAMLLGSGMTLPSKYMEIVWSSSVKFRVSPLYSWTSHTDTPYDEGVVGVSPSPMNTLPDALRSPVIVSIDSRTSS